MNICIYNHYKLFNKNDALFRPESYALVEGGEKVFLVLRKKLEALGHTLTTIDQHSLESYEKYIFLDFPTENIALLQELRKMKKELFLVLLESEMIKPDNWDVANYKYFNRVFGWKPLQNAIYTRLMIAQNLESQLSLTEFDKRKLACLIASNKYASDRRELYSLRRKVIRWFEANAPNEFSLYGKGWECGEKICKNGYLARFRLFRNVHTRPYPSYQGEISRKRQVMGKYRFNFCFENASDLEGYITEKLFDAILAGVVPIYQGAPDVFDFIPREALIYFPDFKNMKALYEYISGMEEPAWGKYLRAARDFINGDKIVQFSSEHFSNTIVNVIV